MPVIIALTPEQLQRAEAEANRRQSVNEARGLKGRNRAPAVGEKALQLHKLGCIGEVAASIFLGVEGFEFSAKEAVRGAADLPGNIEVKTRPKHGYDLLVQIDDDPNKVFVLITHDGLSTQIAGWIRGQDAMKKELIKEYVKGRPCYAVRQNLLKPPETLLEAIGSVNSRILGSHEAWLAEDGDDLVLHFDPRLMRELDWKNGDMLTWDVDVSSQRCIIRKKTDECQQREKLCVKSGMARNGSIEA